LVKPVLQSFETIRMKNILTQILIFVALASFGQDLTTIKVIVPNPTDEIYIAGNQESLGDWNPELVKMNKISDYERAITLKMKFPAEFKFTRGSWKSEANVLDYENGSNIKLLNKTDQVKFVIKSFKDDRFAKGQISLNYDIKYLTSVHYPDEERTIRIFLPDNYDPSTTYPVIYVLDGQSLFDLLVLNVSILQDKNHDDNNIIPECIAVAIDNTNRGRDLTPNTGLSPDTPAGNYINNTEIFYRILNQEIVPFINENYAVSGYNVIIGHSNAGHFVTQLFLKDDNSFKGVIALSVNDFQNYFQETLPDVLRENSTKFLFLGYGNKDDEFNILGDYLENQNIENQNFKVVKYNADHMQLPFTSLFDAIKFMFSDYKFYDDLIEETYNDNFDYQIFKMRYINNIAGKYGIKTDIDYDIYYLLNKAREKNNAFVFHKLLDEVDISNSLQLQLRFYAAYEFHQNERAKNYLYQMLSSSDETDKQIFFATLHDQYYDFFVVRLKQPNEFIDFTERAIEKWPDYQLEFSYLIAKVLIEQKVEHQNLEKYLEYCEKNFKDNRYFTLQELEQLRKK